MQVSCGADMLTRAFTRIPDPEVEALFYLAAYFSESMEVPSSAVPLLFGIIQPEPRAARG